MCYILACRSEGGGREEKVCILCCHTEPEQRSAQLSWRCSLSVEMFPQTGAQTLQQFKLYRMPLCLHISIHWISCKLFWLVYQFVAKFAEFHVWVWKLKVRNSDSRMNTYRLSIHESYYLCLNGCNKGVFLLDAPPSNKRHHTFI